MPSNGRWSGRHMEGTMARVELYNEPSPDDLTGWQKILFSLAHGAAYVVNHISLICELPASFILLIAGAFIALCNVPPTYPTAAALVAALLWWFLVMTIGRYTLRSIVAAALIAEIYRMLSITWPLLSPFKV
jgi:hypothetical protein